MNNNNNKIFITPGKKYKNKYGDEYIILEEVEPKISQYNDSKTRRARIRFTKTGYETIVSLHYALYPNNAIEDKLKPSLFGVGMIGYANTADNPKEYNMWQAMMARCYNVNSEKYATYGAIGIKVCERWKRFDLFMEDLATLPGYQAMIDYPDNIYNLDKDILQKDVPNECKIYSPNTCVIVRQIDNIAIRHMDNKHKSKQKYFGVREKYKGSYQVRITHNNEEIYLGTFDNELAAASCYNYFSRVLGHILLNDIEEMDRKEWVKHLIRPYTMCAIVTETKVVSTIDLNNNKSNNTLFDIDFNKSYYNKRGQEFKIIEEVEPRVSKTRTYRMVKIRFITGYETIARLDYILGGDVGIVDRFTPTVHGVGCLGYAIPKLNMSMYKRWSGMISRCYNENDNKYPAYGGIGVTVCERWKRLDFFLEDIVNLPGYHDMITNPDTPYELDKDTLQQYLPVGQCKIYSPETCMFIKSINNNLQRIIDNKPNYKNNQYYGVQQNKAGNYSVRIRDGKDNATIGTCTDIKAAANLYDDFAKKNNKQLFNDVEYMSREECAKYLVQPIQMLVDENKIYGVKQIDGGNYIVRMSVNGNQKSFGPYTDKMAAATRYNHISFGMGRPMPNKIPYMSPQECAKYLVKPIVMCAIVSSPVPIQQQVTLKEMCAIVK